MKGIFEIEIGDLPEDEKNGQRIELMLKTVYANATNSGVVISVKEQQVRKSKIENCLVEMRNGDTTQYLFGPDGNVHVLLDGYAIVPKEKYVTMKDKLAKARELINRLAKTLPEKEK